MPVHVHLLLFLYDNQHIFHRHIFYLHNHIGGLIVSVLSSSAVDRGFEPRSDQTKDYKIGLRCFSAMYAALRNTIKDWLAWNQDNVFK